MEKYDQTVASSIDGKPIQGAQANIYSLDDPSNPTLATVYADEAGTMPMSQPILTDQLGYFAAYVPDGAYDVRVMAGSIEISRTNIKIVDSLALKQRALLVPMNEDSGTLPPAGERAGKLLGFDDDGNTVVQEVEALAGPPGPAGNVAATLDQLKAAPITNVTMIYDGDTWVWTALDYTGLADDAFVVKSGDDPLTVGAWVRQVARITVKKAGAKGDGIADDAPAFNRAIAAIIATGGTVEVPDAVAYKLGSTVSTGSKRIVFQIGTTTIICPPNGHGLVLQANGCCVRGVSRWATIFRHGTSSVAYPTVATTISGGAVTAATATGGSGMLSTPLALVANSPAADALANDAGVIATVSGGTVTGLAVVAGGADYVAAPSVSFLGGGAAAVVIDGVQGCNVSGFSVDFRNQPGTVGVLHRGGWWAYVHDIDVLYDTATGVLSEHPTSVGLMVDSYTRGAPGPNGDYGGVYVSNYGSLRFTRRGVVGHDTSTATTLQFNTCDIKNSFIHATIGVVDVNPVAQGVAGTDQYHLINVDGLSLIGGDFEDAARWFHFVGTCNNIRAKNTLTYAAPGPRYRGQPGTGSDFDYASSNSTIEPLRIGSAGSAGMAWQNVGWRQLHRQGIQYRGDTWVDSTNVKLFLGASDVVMGNLDDTSAPGSAMVRRGSQMEYYNFSPGSNPRTGTLFGVWNTDGLSIGGAVGLTVGGARVLKPRQAALPPAATDLATAITLLNALRVGVIASTGHGLFEG